jgi:transposase InsO family protein
MCDRRHRCDQSLPVCRLARTKSRICPGFTTATLEWVDWFNHRRLLQPIGNIPPAEAEDRYYAMLESPAMAA